MADTYSNVGGCVPIYRDEFGKNCSSMEGGFCHPEAPTFLPVIRNLTEEELTPDLQTETI